MQFWKNPFSVRKDDTERHAQYQEIIEKNSAALRVREQRRHQIIAEADALVEGLERAFDLNNSKDS